MSFHPKSITDLRSGVGKRRSGQRSPMTTLARLFGPLDFRLLQQDRHKADPPIALADVRFRGTSGLGLSTCDAARPSVAAAPLHLGWHRHRMVLAGTAPR